MFRVRGVRIDPRQDSELQGPLRPIAQRVDEYHYSVDEMCGRLGELARRLLAVQKVSHQADVFAWCRRLSSVEMFAAGVSCWAHLGGELRGGMSLTKVPMNG